MAGKEGGKPPPDADVIQLALRLNKLPEEIEMMDVFWFNRLKIYLEAEADALKL